MNLLTTLLTTQYKPPEHIIYQKVKGGMRMVKKPPKVILTFKENERYIFDEISKHSGKSNWVKDILKNFVPTPEKIKAPPVDTEA
jgi:hypothetical protein